MSITCPNKKLIAWSDLVASQGEDKAYLIWNAYEGIVPDKFFVRSAEEIDFKINLNPREYPIIYDAFNLLNDEGDIHIYPTNKEADAREAKLNKDIDNYDFRVGRVSTNKYKVFITRSIGIAPEVPLQESSGSFIPLAEDEEQTKVSDEALEENNSELLRLKTEQKEEAIKSLDDKLKKIAEIYGVGVKALEEYKGKLDVDAWGLTQFFVNTADIYLAKDHDLMTVPEEFGHVLIEMLNGTNFQKRLFNALKKDEVYKTILGEELDEYTALYGNNVDKLVKEAAGKSVGRTFVTKAQTIQQQPKGIQFILQKVIEFIKVQLVKFPFISMKNEIDVLTNDLVKKVYTGKFEGRLSNIKNEDTFARITQLKTHEEIANSIKKSIGKRITHYTIRGQEKLTKGETERAEKLKTLYDDALFAEGNAKYLQHIIEEAHSLDNSVKNIKELDTSKNLREAAAKLRDVKFYYDSVMPTIEDLENSISDELATTASDEIKEAHKQSLREIGDLKVKLSQMIGTYFRVGNKIMIPLFSPFLGDRNNEAIIEELNKSLPVKKQLSKVDIKTLFTEKTGDISTLSRFLDSLAETNATSLQLLDLFVKSNKEKARLETLDENQELLALNDSVKDGGAFMVSLNSKGENTGEFVVEYDWSALNTALDKAKDNKERVKIYKKYTLSQSDAVNLIKEREESLTPEEFDRWMYFNVKIRKSYGVEYGPTTWYTIPKAKSSQYTAIKSDSAQKKYYDHVMKLKYTKDQQLPEKLRPHRLLPQVYENTIDSIKHLANKDDLKALYEQAKELVTFREDEVERGVKWELSDPEGNEVKFIPIFYNKRLKKPKLISKDITMSMSVYTGMANNFKHMSKALDLIEISADLIKSSDIIKKDDSGKVLMESVKFLMEKIKTPLRTTSSEGTNISDRLKDYLLMQVYGELQKDQGKILWGKVDVVKLANTLGMYTAINQLSVNIPAATANVINGLIQEALDAKAGQFFEVGDLLFADKAYFGTDLGLRVQEIGKHNQTSQIALWTKYKNTLQDYSKGLRGQDTNRNTIFGRLFNTSSLFFLQQGGEHYMQTRTSLALANAYRYADGKFVWKKDYYSKLEDLKYQMRQEIRDVPVDKDTRASVRKIKADYQNKIKSTKESLDKSWKELTNYYDAHEVVGNKLQLKEGFKATNSIHQEFINRQNSLNNSMHGIYNDIDKNSIQQYWQFRLVLMFRKWMIPAFNRRYKGIYYNYERNSFVEGFYSTFFRILARDLKQGSYSFTKNWGSLTDLEKANFKRVITEVATFTAFLTAALILTSLLAGGDDDDNWGLNYSAYISNRMVTELGVLTPSHYALTEGLKILESPTATTTTIEELIRLSKFWTWGEELESGKYKGWTKFEKSVFRLLPATKPLHNVISPEEAMKFYTR